MFFLWFFCAYPANWELLSAAREIIDDRSGASSSDSEDGGSSDCPSDKRRRGVVGRTGHAGAPSK